MSHAHVGVVGAGIVGPAVARRIQQSTSAEVTVVEKEWRDSRARIATRRSCPSGASTGSSHRTGEDSSTVSCIQYRTRDIPSSAFTSLRGSAAMSMSGRTPSRRSRFAGYRWRDVSVGDLWRSATYRGTPRLALENWRMGVREIVGSMSKPVFVCRA